MTNTNEKIIKHKNEFYPLAFRKQIDTELETLQTELDEWVSHPAKHLHSCHVALQ